MIATLVIANHDCPGGASSGSDRTCPTSVAHRHNWLSIGNSIMMDCICFCNQEEAIDIIERRVIPTDSDNRCTCGCGGNSPACSAISLLTDKNHAPVSGNSLHAELPPLIFTTTNPTLWNH